MNDGSELTKGPGDSILAPANFPDFRFGTEGEVAAPAPLSWAWGGCGGPAEFAARRDGWPPEKPYPLLTPETIDRLTDEVRRALVAAAAAGHRWSYLSDAGPIGAPPAPGRAILIRLWAPAQGAGGAPTP